jgi:hypothetical protein
MSLPRNNLFVTSPRKELALAVEMSAKVKAAKNSTMDRGNILAISFSLLLDPNNC